MTSLEEDSMSLSSVLGHVGVDELNDIVSDGSGEDGRHGDAVDDFRLVLFGVNTDNGSGGHLIRYN